MDLNAALVSARALLAAANDVEALEQLDPWRRRYAMGVMPPILFDYLISHAERWPPAMRLALARIVPDLFMDKARFWQLIEQARMATSVAIGATYDASTTGAMLEERLSSLTAEALIGFAAHRDLYISCARRHDLWAAAFGARGGCSDDSFDYFRGWLVAQGESFYEAVITDPQALADYPFGPGVYAAHTDGEWMLSAGNAAFASLTGEAMPHGWGTLSDPDTSRWPEDRLDEGWEESHILEHFPRIAQRFWSSEHRASVRAALALRLEREEAALRHRTAFEYQQAHAAGEGLKYSPAHTYAGGDRVTHPKFGDGHVVKVRPGRKMDVLFARGLVTLVHARG